MDVDGSDTDSNQNSLQKGFALLLGPNFSIAINQVKVTLGRHKRTKSTDSHRRKMIKEREKEIFSGKLARGLHSSLHKKHQRSTSQLYEKEESKLNLEESPLFWRMQVIENAKKSKPQIAIPTESNEVENTNETQIDSATNVEEEKNVKDQDTVEVPESVLPMEHFDEQTEEIGQSNMETDADIDLGPDPLISHHHATLSYDDELEQWDVTCHSTNGMFVNGRTIFPSDGAAPLYSKSRIQIGCVLFFFLLPIDPKQVETNKVPFVRPNVIPTGFIQDKDLHDVSTTKPGSLDNTTSNSSSVVFFKKKWSQIRTVHPMKKIDNVTAEVKKTLPKRPKFSLHVMAKESSALLDYVENIQEGQPDIVDQLHLNPRFNPILEEYHEHDKYMNYSVYTGARPSLPAIESNGEPVVRKPGRPPNSSTDSQAQSTPKQKVDKRMREPAPKVDISKLPPSALVKPKLNFGQLITLALESSPEKRMPFPEITDWILEHFPYYHTVETAKWHNSTRHQLSNNKIFTRQARLGAQGPGKGGLWCLAEWYSEDGKLLSQPRKLD